MVDLKKSNFEKFLFDTPGLTEGKHSAELEDLLKSRLNAILIYRIIIKNLLISTAQKLTKYLL